MRILAAIMFTDIEGFTSLMQHNEAEALRLLDQHKQFFQHHTTAWKGKVIKHIGDGTLTIFNSALQAVQCAIDLQRSYNAIPGLHVRIGIHIGDVVQENKDVFGDAVNLASRIQSGGIAGGVVVSEKVQVELHNHPEFETIPMGMAALKNVDQPVALFAIKAAGLKLPEERIKVHDQKTPSSENEVGQYIRKWIVRLRKPLPMAGLLFLFAATIYMFTYRDESRADDMGRTIAVIPFGNGGDTGSNFIAYAITEITQTLLTRKQELLVMELPSHLNDSGKTDELKRYLLNQKIGFVVSGSVIEYEGKILATISLKDTRTGVVVLKNNIELPSGDLIKAAERIAQGLVKRMDVQNGTLQLHFFKKHIPDSIAYRKYLEGKYAQQTRDSVDLKKALRFFRKAIEIDPDFAQAYASLCDNYVLMAENRVISFFEGGLEARRALDSAILLDSGLAEVQASLALYLTNIEGKKDAALQALSKAVSIDSNYIEAHQWYAVELSSAGYVKEAISHIDVALESSPLTVRVWEQKLMILIFARKYAEAIRLAMSVNSELMGENLFAEQVTECYYRLGKKDSALRFASLIENSAAAKLWFAIINKDNQKLLEILSGEASKADPNHELLTFLYTLLDKKENAISTLNTALSNNEYNFLKFLKVDPRWDPLRNEPGFQALLLRLRL